MGVGSRLQSGEYVLQVEAISDADYGMGTLITPNAPTNNTVYNPLVVPSVVSYAAANDTVQTAYSYAGQKTRGKRDMGVSQLGDGTLTLSEFDDAFDALVMGYLIDTATATSERIAGHNVNRGKALRLLLAFSPAATPVNGLTNFDTIYTWGTLRRGALGTNQGTGSNPNNRAYTLTKFTVTRNPWGQLFSADPTAVGTLDDEKIVYSDAPQMSSTFIADGTATTWLLPYAPEYTEHAGAWNKFYKNGVEAKASISGISGSTITLSGAGSAADKWRFVGPCPALLNVT